MTPTIRYGQVRVGALAHITIESVDVNGRCTWGQRLTCLGCGEVDECHAGSSVSYEDAPAAFARKHADCIEGAAVLAVLSVRAAREDPRP